MKELKYGMVYFKNFKNEDFVWGLLALGKDVEIIDTEISRESTKESDANALYEELLKNKIDVAVSFDFCPALSDACIRRGMPYISWIYDAPIQMVYEDQIKNNCNYIFSFDRVQIKQIRERGAENVFYMPLGTNLLRNGAIEISDLDREKYACTVSFIGSLYSNSDYESAIKSVDEKVRLELEKIKGDVFGKWDGVDRLYGRMSVETINCLKSIFQNETAMDDDALYATALIAKAVAYEERVEMLKRLADYDINFYTYQSDVSIPGIKVRGALDYLEELPKAYFFSRINMNITMPGITSGIPLRVFDIMGMGGFVLTNYQPEVEELFEIGKNIEVYHDFDEMVDKVKFYSDNENARKKIALNGKKIIEGFSIEKRVREILVKAGL